MFERDADEVAGINYLQYILWTYVGLYVNTNIKWHFGNLFIEKREKKMILEKF